MSTNRRQFVFGSLSAGLLPSSGWAAIGAPRYISASKQADGRYQVVGLSNLGETVFACPLPARGHAAAAHPLRTEVISFARRPGRFALVLNCETGDVLKRLDPPNGYHFYGHGTFGDQGRFLYTTENDYENARGMIGVWDADNAYRRVGSFESGGIGPHDIKWCPKSGLIVANGGIETHPESGRAKLNLATMQPNVSYFSGTGELLEKVSVPPSWHKNSLRHLAVSPGGLVAVASQWQGAQPTPPLTALHRRGVPFEFLDFPDGLARDFLGYVGSISYSDTLRQFMITSPKGGLYALFSEGGRLMHTGKINDVCGAAAHPEGFLVTTGVGDIYIIGESGHRWLARHDMTWDNHLTSLA